LLSLDKEAVFYNFSYKILEQLIEINMTFSVARDGPLVGFFVVHISNLKLAGCSITSGGKSEPTKSQMQINQPALGGTGLLLVW
jgi:hypothetical protein